MTTARLQTLSATKLGSVTCFGHFIAVSRRPGLCPRLINCFQSRPLDTPVFVSVSKALKLSPLCNSSCIRDGLKDHIRPSRFLFPPPLRQIAPITRRVFGERVGSGWGAGVDRVRVSIVYSVVHICTLVIQVQVLYRPRTYIPVFIPSSITHSPFRHLISTVGLLKGGDSGVLKTTPVVLVISHLGHANRRTRNELMIGNAQLAIDRSYGRRFSSRYVQAVYRYQVFCICF